jgi:hypothetical protein
VTLAGTLRMEGRPVGGQDVLAFDAEADRPALLATAITDDEGRFSLDPGGAPARVDLLGKLRVDALAAVARSVEPSADGIELEATGPFATVTATIESDAGFPERLNVYFDPVALDGLPERLAPFVTQKAEGVFEGHFSQRSVNGRELTIRLARGTWRLGGDFIVYERPMISEPDFSNYVVDRVLREDGTELPRQGSSGFLLEADGELRIRLELRELADTEL